MTVHHHTKICPKHPDCLSVRPVDYLAIQHNFPIRELLDAVKYTCHLVRLSTGDFAVCLQCANEFNRIIGLATYTTDHA